MSFNDALSENFLMSNINSSTEQHEFDMTANKTNMKEITKSKTFKTKQTPKMKR